MPELNVNIPHLYCYIRREYLYDLTAHHGEVDACAVFGIASIPSRAIMFHVMLDIGAQFARMPISALCWKPDAPPMPLHALELWDAFSYHATVTTFDFLKEMRCAVRLPEPYGWQAGQYLFTVDWHSSAYAEDPGEGGHKNAHIIRLDNGNFAAQPNNRCRWYEGSFITKDFPEHPDFLTNNQVWSAEYERKCEDTARYFYEVT